MTGNFFVILGAELLYLQKYDSTNLLESDTYHAFQTYYRVAVSISRNDGRFPGSNILLFPTIGR